MIYKFKSKACGDLIMLGPMGDLLLRLLRREPSASGIIEVRDMTRVREDIERGIAAAEAGEQAQVTNATANADAARSTDDEDAPNQAVGLRQRLWPFLQMLQEAQAANEPIVWGV